jgi:zinc transport system substrate-binding protein
LAATAAALAVSGCASSSGSSGGRETVVAAFYPLAFAAEQIGDGRVHVDNLTPAGAEPHDLEVSPSQVRDIRSAGLVLLLGRGFQPQVEDAAGSGSGVLRLLDTPGLDLLPDNDPHVWLDPHRYALIARRIGAELHERRRAARFATRLRALDSEFRNGLAHCARRDVVTSHEAFAYLAQRYGLHQIAITGLSPEAEPSPRDLERVVTLVRDTHATTVFYETLVSPRVADSVAREAHVSAAVLNPIEGLTPDEEKRGDDYFSLMRANLAALRRALACRWSRP